MHQPELPGSGTDSEQLARELERAAQLSTDAVQHLAQALDQVTLSAEEKRAVAEKHDREDLRASLFGGPPRNRHERRTWAKMQREQR